MGEAAETPLDRSELAVDVVLEDDERLVCLQALGHEIGEGALPDPDEAVIDAAAARARHRFTIPAGDLNGLRERLQRLMWDRVGILRSHAGLTEAMDQLTQLSAELGETGLPDGSPVFNLTWHDWLNLDSQLLVSQAIAQAALAREESRGAHFR